jgi:hypothetical protein
MLMRSDSEVSDEPVPPSGAYSLIEVDEPVTCGDGSLGAPIRNPVDVRKINAHNIDSMTLP